LTKYIIQVNEENSNLPAFVTIISVPSSLNSSHKGFTSNCAATETSLGWRGFLSSATGCPDSLKLADFSLPKGDDEADEQESPVEDPEGCACDWVVCLWLPWWWLWEAELVDSGEQGELVEHVNKGCWKMHHFFQFEYIEELGSCFTMAFFIGKGSSLPLPLFPDLKSGMKSDTSDLGELNTDAKPFE